MDFSRLPASAFLKIFEYLQLEECIRVGRVNKTFRQFAQLATSRTKYLDLTEDRFQNLTPDQLSVILDLCAPNLKQIKIGGDFGDDDRWQQLATTFALYEFPRLTDIDLQYTPIDRAVFEQLIRNTPRLESMEWRRGCVGFPAITNNNLKKLSLHVCNDAILQTVIGHCPNLEELDLSAGNLMTVNMLDQFFASIPNARRVSIDVAMQATDFENAAMINFYNLQLTTLSINFVIDDYAGDDLLFKVAASFPNLRELTLGLVEPTDAGLALLANLQELQVIVLYLSDVGEPYDEGMRQLTRCQKLRKLEVVPSNMAAGTLVYLLRGCPQLEYVKFWDLTEVDSPDEAVVILESLSGIPKRDITIRFFFPFDDDDQRENFKSIWQGDPAKDAIKKLEEDEGIKIMIEKD